MLKKKLKKYEEIATEPSAEKKMLDMQSAVGVLSKHVTSEVFRIVESQREKIGKNACDITYMSVLASIVGTVVLNTITEQFDKKVSNTEVEKILHKNYNNLKMAVQDSIATGFTEAMTKYSGKTCEYYCQIKPLPPPVNKQPC